MAIGDVGLAAGIRKEASTAPFQTFLSRYFYFCMSLVLSGVVVWGFSQTIDNNLFHAVPARPWLLWIHGAAFSTWVVFYVVQSALVRARKVGVHRVLGWFGAGLATLMVVLGFTIAVIMGRFDVHVLRQPVEAFLSVPFADMGLFGAFVAMAIYWRKKPEYHRRLMFLGCCSLMDAPFGRFDFIFNHNLYYIALDGLILLGPLRDWLVDGRVHKVYLYAAAPLIAVQSFAVYLWAVKPVWWQAATHAILS